MVLDGCMVYAAKEASEAYFGKKKEYYHIPLFEDMFVQYLNGDLYRGKTKVKNKKNGDLYRGKTKVFFLNMFDHPIILNEVLPTNFLMSCDSAPRYADIPFPFADVWLLHKTIKLGKGDHYSNMKRNIKQMRRAKSLQDVDLDKRISKAVFRGSLTGCDPLDPKKNLRLQVYLHVKHSLPASDQGLFDVELTGYFKGVIANDDAPDGVLYGLKNYSKVLTKATMHALQQKRNPLFMNPNHLFAKYRYVLSIDGYVSPWRLPYELLFGNVVFIFGRYTVFFENELKSNVNCFRVKSISEVVRHIRYLEEHPERRRKIAREAHKLGKKLLSKRFIFEKLRQSLHAIPDI
jgi:hypothetical protein